MIFLLFQHISAQQVSTFTIPGWTPGTTPVFSGTSSNVINLNYGDSLNTSVAFAGTPTDGIGTDNDNIAFQSFSYSYTVYLTQAGGIFSTTSSIPVGTHSISAFQSCSSGTMPPWTISYDAQPTKDTNNLNMDIKDGIADCIAPGDYQVDIVFDSYSVNSVGPAALPIQLQWSGYANNSPARGLTQFNAPSTVNTTDVALNPVSSYLLSKIAFVHVDRPVSCPPVNLSLPRSIETFAQASSATVTASYPGHCEQNVFTYLWSNGETTATAVNLFRGTHTVTVTSPCGASASASITISYPTAPGMSAITAPAKLEAASPSELAAASGHNKDKKASANASADVEAHLKLYPNPAKHNITFDFAIESDANSSVRIYDMLGNEMMTANANTEAGNQKMEVNLDELPAGVYLYELTSDKTFRGKFVKQ
jgi:hypothetical protein